jgi:serine/threonine-protein kinase
MQSPGSSRSPSSPDVNALLGQLIAERYRVEELLGEGGMGAVYRATHIQLQKSVALKVLHAHLTQIDEAVARFEREAVASARIEHANVVNATDFGRLDDGAFFLVLEYVKGKSLRDLLDNGPLPEPRALHIAKQIVQALGAAHSQGIIHRDLKPDNVMLVEKDGDGDFVKVLDFGIAKINSSRETKTPTLTRFGAVFGTPQYMAPEQAAGRTVDVRADLYAVGIILHEMLSGRAPFDADDLLVLLTQQMTQPPPALPNWVSPSTNELIARLLEKEPESRFQTASDLLAVISGQPLPRSGVRKKAPGPGFAQRWQALSRQTKTLLIAAPALLSMVTAVVALWPNTTTPVVPRPDAPLAERISPDVGALLDLALQGNANAFADLEALAKDEPSAENWLAVARARKATGKLNEALAAYTAAVKTDTKVQNDPSLLSDLRQLASNDQIYEQVLSFAVTDLGASGVDLLIDVWLSAQGTSLPSQRAKKLLEDPKVREQGTPAARLALELREARGCDAQKALLARAKTEADDRSSIPLGRFLGRRGCGFLGLSDCYSCLRAGPDLGEAIAAAKSRPAPRFTPVPNAATAPVTSATPASNPR